MKQKFVDLYTDIAKRVADLSHARRLKVGAIIVKEDRIISIGYNGMPAGWENDCEDKVWIDSDAGSWLSPKEITERWPHVEYNEDAGEEYRYALKTKPEVLHAESNAIAKLARNNESGLDAAIFVTHSPCLECAKLILQSGINKVYYGHAYRDNAGLEFLRKSKIEVIKTGD